MLITNMLITNIVLTIIDSDTNVDDNSNDPVASGRGWDKRGCF